MMKNAFSKRIAALLLALPLLFSGCSDIRYGIYEAMIGLEHLRAGVSADTMDVNGKKIAYLKNGGAPEKPALVLLHGFSASKENWVRFAGHLTDRFRILAPDLPGHGDSTKSFSLSYDIADQADYLEQILAALNIDKCHLAGNSMGGAIACLFAARHADRVLSLTLLNSAGIYEHESQLTKMLKHKKNPFIVNNKDDFDALVAFAMEKHPFIPWPIKSVFAEKIMANRAINKKIFKDIYQGRQDRDFREKLPRIQAPTLIIWGRQDRLIHVDNSAIFEKLIPDARRRVLDGIGHMPMIEAPGETAKAFKVFALREKRYPKPPQARK